MSSRPAWSGQFSQEGLQLLEPIDTIESITPDWAWGGSTGKGVKVAVIDSGIDASHPVLGGNVSGYVAISEGPDGLIFDETPHSDDYGHGTACAGIIRSIAPECSLYSIKVLGPGLSGRGIVFAAGIQWALDNGMHVCNLSLGSTKKDFFGMLHELTDRAYFENVMLVTAANNMPVASFPSTYAAVISVAAHDVPDPNTFYYNPKPPVEFGALGILVEVPWRRGGWLTATGNSFAAPHMTGVVTKILARHPDLTIFHMKSVLRALAANVVRGSGGNGAGERTLDTDKIEMRGTI
jgi:subtilisin